RDLLRPARRRERGSRPGSAGPRGGGRADLRSRGPAGLPLPAPGRRGRSGGGDGALRAERRQRDRRALLPGGTAALRGDTAGDRANAVAARLGAGARVRVAVRGRPAGAGGGGGGGHGPGLSPAGGGLPADSQRPPATLSR